MASAGNVLQSSIQSPSSDLWIKALSCLNTDRKIYFDTSRIDKWKIINEVLILVREAEQTCQHKRWKWKNSRGEYVILWDVFSKIAGWIQKFREIGDIIVQYDPGHAALPWAAVRFILRAIVSDVQKNGAMLQSLELVFNLMAKFAIVERLYLREHVAARRQLEESITSMYISILEYLSEAIEYYKKGTLSKIITSVFQLEDSVTKHQSAIKAKAEIVDSFLRLLSDEVTFNTNDLLNGVMDNINSGLQDIQLAQYRTSVLQDEICRETEGLRGALVEIHEPIIRMANQISIIDDKLNEEERLKIFEWLSCTEYTSHHRSKVKNLLPGSGQWLLHKPEFIEWLGSSSSSILWLHGIPGSGKSMLVAHVIEFLRRHSSRQVNPAPVAYYYCARSANEPERADPEELLRSILEQLASSDLDSPIRLEVVSCYKRKKRDSRGRKPEKLTLEETVELILELVANDPAVIVLDGLDECNPKRRLDLLDSLRRILREADNIVKVFVSSRDDHDLVHYLSRTPNLYIKANDNMEDIRNYVKSRVDEAILKERILCGVVLDDLRLLINKTLISKAKGMFRLASLHIERLCDPYQIKTVENAIHALSNLPEDLRLSYEAVMAQIKSSQQPTPILAERVLKWLLCAQQALDPEGFIVAICFDLDGDRSLRIEDILSICSNLVVYDDVLNRFRFAHLSVQEYLESLESYAWPAVTALAAENCLSWLLSNQPRRLSGTGEVSFSHHVDAFWPTYTLEAAQMRKTEPLQLLLKRFLYPNPMEVRGCLEFERWVERTASRVPGSTDMGWVDHCISTPPNPLFVTCAFAFDEILPIVLADTESFFVTNSLQLNCAGIAAQTNEPAIMKAICAAGRGHELSYDYWQKVVIIAAMTCCTDTLSVLLQELGPNYVTKGLLSVITQAIETPNHAESKCEEVLQLLLENNKSLQVSEDILSFAVNRLENHRLKIVRPLLKLAYGSNPTTVLCLNVRPEDENDQFISAITGVSSYLGGKKHDVVGIIVCHGEGSPPSIMLRPLADQEWWDNSISQGSSSEFALRPLTFEILVGLIRRNQFADQPDNKAISIMLVNRERGGLRLTWKDLVTARSTKRGRFCLFLLIQMKPELDSKALNMLISLWDEWLVRAVLEYRPIKITDNIVRVAAGNFWSGENIMKVLLEHDPEYSVQYSSNLIKSQHLLPDESPKTDPQPNNSLIPRSSEEMAYGHLEYTDTWHETMK
ncbi:hypothetical protein BGZ60DRAFT_524047 [Tricladium varicosporioides]|nr:hypothetical protein BGZ60DRAFT_524047 [Hymenoscyphus varicosporioides]